MDKNEDEIDIIERNKTLNPIMQVFQVVADATGSIVFIFDCQRQSILISDYEKGQWGLMREQKGVPYERAESDLVPEESKAEYIRLHEEMMNGAMEANGKVMLRDKNGSIEHYELTFRALLDDEGRPTGKAAGIYKNITKYQEHYMHQFAMTKALSEGVASAYYIDFDHDTFIVEQLTDSLRSEVASFVNQQEQCFSQTIEKYCRTFVHEDDLERMLYELQISTMLERLSEKRSYYIQYKVRENKDNQGYFEIHITEADEGDNVRRAFMSFRCMDEQKEKELMQQRAMEEAYRAANQANAAKTDFLSNMSHDIRTPLNAIIGMTAIACAHIDDRDRVQDCLSKITVSSKHLLGIINEVLDMSKIESGRLDLNLEDFDLAELVDNMITMSKPQIEAKNHELFVDVHGIEHELVTGDSQRIQQAFMNLMSNAIKYTPEGGIIRLSITEKPTNKAKVGYYEFVFEDNGIGMSEEFQKHLFEPFARDSDIRVQRQQGTGLGMAITRNIVRMMNGDIDVESVPGKGTKFKVTIFLTLQDVKKEASDNALIDLPVLVADDDRITCESACDMLYELGMLGEWVLTGEEAVDRVVQRHDRQDDYFAVILDWKMPGMDGVATTRAIRKVVGDEVPIIVISAYDWSDIEMEARAAGANAFISKPMFKSRMEYTFKAFLGHDTDKDKLNGAVNNIEQQDFSGKRVLLVEDNELNAEIASEILQMTNLTVEYVRDGYEALHKMEEVPDGYYDMVFMDIQMPVMNGYEATRAIRAIDRSYLQRVPIIAMTANAFAEDVEAAHDVGMNEHISKPIDFNQLLKVLNKWLKP